MHVNEKMAKFWQYFNHTWIKLHKPDLWNIHSALQSEDSETVLINRTNNPVERFNRRMNELLPTPHPSMVSFVNAIRSECDRSVTFETYLIQYLPFPFCRFLKQMSQIQRARQVKKKHLPVHIRSPPEDFEAFKQDQLSAKIASPRKKSRHSVD